MTDRTSKTEVAWLIESSGDGRTRWLNRFTNAGGIGWTYDANEAVRFTRECDAEAVRPVVTVFCPVHWGVKSTEHMWSGHETSDDVRVQNLLRALDAKQAKIDSLMMEFCPGEMSKEQREEWAKHQQPVSVDLERSITESFARSPRPVESSEKSAAPLPTISKVPQCP